MKRLLLIGIVALTGCSTQLGKFTVYAPEPIDLSKGEYTVDRTKRIRGVDPSTLYFVFPSNPISYDQAVKNAMTNRIGCVGLVDATITRKAFWLLGGYCDFEAEGYPIIKKGAK